jgi:hypothetical protein
MWPLSVFGCGGSFAKGKFVTSAFADVKSVACGYVLYTLWGIVTLAVGLRKH